MRKMQRTAKREASDEKMEETTKILTQGKEQKTQRSERRAPHGLQGSSPFDKQPHV
jgi:hypothetical protein